ncbi:DUF5663 domain-containing protein [Schaalia cardiffensis]|uniref:DUF5663 domain-containing protein n=1 Tax=Schaalia cardiffensis TaxID=181487 RepID=UPI0023F26A1D|nr:DUF5663 domain-containing protein [Schaalia cardiffensis]
MDLVVMLTRVLDGRGLRRGSHRRKGISTGEGLLRERHALRGKGFPSSILDVESTASFTRGGDMKVEVGSLIRSAIPDQMLEWFGEEEIEKLAGATLAEIEMRLGERLSRRLTSGELDEFDRLTQNPDADELEAAKWLSRKIPNLHEATKNCIDEVVSEVARTLMAVYERENEKGRGRGPQ